MEGGAESVRPSGAPLHVHGEMEAAMRKVMLKGKGGEWERALDREEEEEF